VGGGNAFDELSAKAAECNAAIGRDVIRLTGSRTDIAELCAAANAFVGVSRAALEAMSCERPTVLVGPLGYSGIMREEILPEAKATNFCFRGSRLAEVEDVTRDLLEIYHMSDEERAAHGALGRQVVLSDYSVRRMADDHIAVYERLQPTAHYKHSDVIISGYYGFDNVGDDSLLSAMIGALKARCPGVRITVLAKNPRKLSRICGVRTINRFNLPKIASEMRRAKLLISGGGTLLQDGTSRKSLLYYITIMKMAKKRGLSLMLYANGLGPLASEKSRRQAAAIMEAADFISLREPTSEAFARELGVKAALCVSADPAFLTLPSSEQWCEHIKNREKIDGELLIVSVKEGSNFGEAATPDVVGAMAEDIKATADKFGLTPIFVPMHESRDLPASKKLCAAVGAGKVIAGLSAPELCGLMRNARLVIGTRLHMLIFAASMGVPMVGVSYDPKIAAFLDYIGQNDASLDVRTLAPGKILAAAEGVMAREDEIRRKLTSLAPGLRDLAANDADKAAEFLGNEA
ncbi:MAG: polysaccharide pyruvyl transferase CsaB, partial [Ruminococcaceae bacterium]|nr:polysaccharide pyruvyl transferase CsaB [Oscillospiraceae bacterium]